MAALTGGTARLVANGLLRPLSASSRRRPDLWLFGHEEGAFAGNSKFLYLWMRAHRPDIEAMWITHRADVAHQLRAHGLPVCRRGTLAAVNAALRAGVYLYCFGPWEVSIAFGRGAYLVNLWHGVGLKAVQYGDPRSAASRATDPGLGLLGHIRELGGRLDPDLLIATSPFTQRHFADQFRLPVERCPPLGYPRLDPPLDHKLMDLVELIERGQAKRLRDDATEELYVYAPTYRDTGRDFLAEALPSLERLNAVLETRRALLYLKLHHRTPIPNGLATGRIRSWPHEADLYSAFPFVDGLITDYSSLHYDWIFRSDRGAVLYTFDQQSYESADRTLLHPFDENVAGWRARNFDELLELIVTGRALEAHPGVPAVRRKFWGSEEGPASPRIVAAIEEGLRQA
jgi:CDP-glycerol glycerophosphotransferase (TagB/SpsB family)